MLLRFLNSVLHLAHAAETRTEGWDDWARQQKHHERRPEFASLPQDAASRPDLVYFGAAERGTKWQETQALAVVQLQLAGSYVPKRVLACRLA